MGPRSPLAKHLRHIGHKSSEQHVSGIVPKARTLGDNNSKACEHFMEADEYCRRWDHCYVESWAVKPVSIYNTPRTATVTALLIELSMYLVSEEDDNRVSEAEMRIGELESMIAGIWRHVGSRDL